MLKFFGKLVGENFLLKVISLVLAVGLWFYIVGELNKGAEEERLVFQKIFPSYGMITKKLEIKPIVMGKPKRGFTVIEDKIAVYPSYCIVIGPKSVLKDIKEIDTVPIDISGADKIITRAVPLKSIAPGIFVEETLVAATIPIERGS
jgi:YbbR domain-containing protein